MVSHIVRVVSIDAHTARKIQPRDKKKQKILPSNQTAHTIARNCHHHFRFHSMHFMARCRHFCSASHKPHQTREKHGKIFYDHEFIWFFFSFLAGRQTSVANACSRHCSKVCAHYAACKTLGCIKRVRIWCSRKENAIEIND